MKSLFQYFFLVVFVVFTSCHPSQENASFQYEIPKGVTPWSHTDFDADQANFTFAIISDLTGGEREGVFETAVKQVNLLRPELVLSVGDLIEGGTEDRAQLMAEWDDFDRRASKLIAPLFKVGGNHDLTNTEMRKVWADRYGPRYYHFIYKNVLFLILDSEDYGEKRMQEIYEASTEAMAIIHGEIEGVYEESEYASMEDAKTGEISAEQSNYFAGVIAKYPDVRWTMVFMHKPTWRRNDDGGMAKIEAALGNRPYTVFNGHYHSFSYEEKNNRDYTILGTTGGFQTPEDQNSFDHISLVTLTNDGPSIAHIRMDGILDKTGNMP